MVVCATWVTHLIGVLMKVAPLGLLAVMALLAGCNMARGAVAYSQSTAKFAQCTSDPRIFCEPGSEVLARSIAPLMADSVATVERAHYGRFTAPIRVQVYRAPESFGKYSAMSPAAYGATTLGVVHLSPRLADGTESHQAILTHELSHLHLSQHAGTLALMRLPNWFMEGWATAVSDGGGARPITREQAVFALVHGRHFEAEADGSLFFPKRASEYKLAGPMYYRQASMMVDYMKQRDSLAFERMINDLVSGKAFSEAVQVTYGRPISVLWSDFREELSRDPAASWNQTNPGASK
jgi:predicted small secreted protein